nr:cell wall-binding repeat-containing protein [Tissierella sp.]
MYNKVLSIFLVLAILVPGLAQAAPMNAEVKRLSGSNRIQTAINVSKEAYKNGAKSIILSGYSGSADALSGSLLASDKSAPLLLSPKGDKVSKELKNEIIRLGANNIYILGGINAVSKGIESELIGMNLNVERVSGPNRYATAVSIAEKAKDKTNLFLALGKKVLANGKEDALADALAIGSVSAKEKMPVLLTQANNIPKETKDAMEKFGVTNVTIVGGKLAISEAIENELKEMGITVARKDGKNRYDTATKIAKDYFKDSKNTIVANGRTDTDALVGGYLGALYNAPILLTDSAKLSIETKEYIKDYSIGSYVLGGEAVITHDVFKDVQITNGVEEESLGGETSNNLDDPIVGTSSKITSAYNQAYQENYSTDSIAKIEREARNAYILLDSESSSAVNMIPKLKKNNNEVSAYISVGSGETWRKDFNELKPFLVTKQWGEWAGEYFVSEVTTGILPVMKKRLDRIASLGFDWVEFDNMDWAFDSKMRREYGFKTTTQEATAYYQELARYANSLGLKVMAKNTAAGTELFAGVTYESYNNNLNWWIQSGLLGFLNQGKLGLIVHYNESNPEAAYKKYQAIYGKNLLFMAESTETKGYINFVIPGN